MQLIKPTWVTCDGRALMSIDIHPDGARFAVGGQGVDCGRVSIWNMKPILDSTAEKDKAVPKLLTQMDHHEGCVNCVRWSHDGKYLATAGDDKLVMIWEKSAYGGGAIFGSSDKVHVESWRLRHTLRGHNGDVLHVAWGPFDNVFASASVDNTIMIWNAESFPNLITTLRGHTGLVKGVVFDPVGKYLASQSDDKTLRIWRTSDWTEETVVEKPFNETGATTHVLRPDWSPDGALLVSAHAMNGGGPTAQIVERSGWKTHRDFVGHRKAVACVRFNRSIFEKKNSHGKTETYATIALGSRDRSISIWSTNLKRPFLVINDLFEQSVLDLSWSKDGRILLACSMDGTVAGMVFNSDEIGSPMSDSQLHSLMQQVWGKSFGKPIVNKGKQNGTVVIENPEMLRLNANGQASSSNLATAASSKATAMPLKGPTDKQIEARTSDGRRRITPIFIPPPAIENGATVSATTTPFGSIEFGSSSTQAKSQITIEKRDNIIEPNISPNKHSSDGNGLMAQRCPSNGDTSSQVIGPTSFPEPAKATTTNPAKPIEPPVNLIAVKRKPGPPAATPAMPNEPKNLAKTVSPETTKPPTSGESLQLSKKKRRVILDSSDDEDGKSSKPVKKLSGSSSSGSGSSSGSDSDSSGGGDGESGHDSSSSSSDAEVQFKKDVPKINADHGDKLKVSKLKKPSIMLKRQAKVDVPAGNEEQRKRIKPLPVQDHDPVSNGYGTATQPNESSLLPEATLVDSFVSNLLPPLRAQKSLLHSFTFGKYKANLNVTNFLASFGANCSVHKIKCSIQGSTSWECLVSSAISGLASGCQFVVATCQDGSFHVFDALSGSKLYPPFALDSPVAKLTVQDSKVAIITSNAHVYVWDLSVRRVIMKESIVSLLRTSGSSTRSVISKLNFMENGRLLIVTSVGKSFVFNEAFATWMRLADTGSSVQSISDFASASANLPNETQGLPLASLSYLTPTTAPRFHNINDEVRVAASITHCQDQILSATYLQSPKEFRYWMMAQIKTFAQDTNIEKLRSKFRDLLGPVSSGDASTWDPKIMGFDKRELLREALDIIAGNLELQRLYSEFSEQLNASNELKELDSILDV